MNYNRPPNTDRTNRSFDRITIDAVWAKGTIVPGINPMVRRKDSCGAWIDRNAYGQTVQHGTGWEIDHIRPVSKDGTDVISNLQPLQWENNRSKGDEYPAVEYCTVFAAR